ncbi:MAG: branched-chain amino acid ABC transporter permease [Armatimonadota bacterium]|nr:branched-chain amino acid ABC transporter permease [Armatimonadota bacterium]MDR5703594.1 branched-chain amino acid ABC transporter permease [Armatimonadota bacterium]MDR7433892.1 branched-chain amino acid ABC transporter permease [Armatimonadota bacterium]
MMRNGAIGRAWLGVRLFTGFLLIFFALLPRFSSTYVVYLTIHILILSLFALGFNLLFGYTGLLSFGQAGFYAVGAYVCARILLVRPSLLLGVVGGMLAACLVSLVVGALSVRHTRIYFSMLTLAFGMIIFSLAWKWRDVTGGDDGLVGIPRAPLVLGPLAVDMTRLDHYYSFVFFLAVLAIWFMYRIVTSPFGLTLQAIRDSEVRASFTGIPVRAHRFWAFVIAGTYAGLAGSLLPPLENTVTPPVAHWTTSAEPVLATLLGGIHSFAGPIVGAFLLFVIKDLIVRVTIHWSIVLGITVIVLVMGFRGGVAGVLAGLFQRVVAVKVSRTPEPIPVGSEGEES